jgi:hypothetical protein
MNIEYKREEKNKKKVENEQRRDMEIDEIIV